MALRSLVEPVVVQKMDMQRRMSDPSEVQLRIIKEENQSGIDFDKYAFQKVRDVDTRIEKISLMTGDDNLCTQ